MRTARLDPLSGLLAVVLLFAGLAVGGSTPSGTSSTEHVVEYYATHRSSQTASGVLLGLGCIFFLAFAASLAARLRVSDVRPGAAALSLVGAGVFVVGLAIYAGLGVALADASGRVSDSSLTALNLVGNEALFIFVVTVGASAFLLGAAAAVLSSQTLPRWLGWVAFALALVAAVPSHVLGGTLDHVGFGAVVGLFVWTAIVSVLLVARAGPVDDRPAATELRGAPEATG